MFRIALSRRRRKGGRDEADCRRGRGGRYYGKGLTKDRILSINIIDF
jgi:hypothetical protein